MLSTDDSNSNKSDFNSKQKTNGYLKNNNKNTKGKGDEDNDVNVENTDDDEDVVVSKEKYDKEKLLKKQALNGVPTRQSADLKESHSEEKETSTIAPVSASKQNSQPTQTRYETSDSDKKGEIFATFYII